MKQPPIHKQQPTQQDEVVLYQPDETISLEVHVKEGTVWLTQQQMAELFGKDRTAISRRIHSIYQDGILNQTITCAKFAHMGSDGDQQYFYNAYNLDVVISVGNRVRSPRGLQLKQWLDQYLSETKNNGIIARTVDLQTIDLESVGGEIVLYQPDDTTRLEVRMDSETVWLTQAQIVELFQSSKANISDHISNIYEQGELPYEATVRNFRTVQKEGGRMNETSATELLNLIR